MVWSRLFGRKNNLNLSCNCTACCGGELDDPATFPNVLYAAVSTDVGSWHSIPLMKQPAQPACPCDGVSSVSYLSGDISIRNEGLPAFNNFTCCLAVALRGGCSDGTATVGGITVPKGECYWTFDAYWTGGEPLTYSENVSDLPTNLGDNKVSCPIGLNFEQGGTSTQPGCLWNGVLGTPWTVIISNTAGGFGDPYVPCEWVCCPEPRPVLYATIVSSCDYLDGLVIPLYFVGQKEWRGRLSCGVLTIYYFEGRIWDDENECDPQIIIESAASGTCFSFHAVGSAIGCQARVFGGSWNAGLECTKCCTGGDSISITVSA